MKKTLLFLIILLAIIISPKVNAEMIRIYDDEINTINENLIGRIYKYGTPINLGDYDYNVEYIVINRIGTYNNNPSNASTAKYIGYNIENVNLEDYSEYWEISNIEHNSSVCTIRLVPAITNYNICDLDELQIDGTCNFGAMAYSLYWGDIYYVDNDDNDLGSDSIDQWENYYPRIGYTDSESLKNIAKVWKLVQKNVYGGSAISVTFAPTDEEITDNPEFSLVCDKKTINYKETTTCHFNAKNYLITGNKITITLEEKDDLELIKTIPSEYFKVEKRNNLITVTPKCISTAREDVELFSFEVQARKEKNEVDNIKISNISYYEGETYTNLKTTVNIENRNYLTSNPLTANPTLFKIILVSAFLISCTTLLIKRESV